MQKNWWDAFPDGEDQQAGIVTKPADPTLPYKVPTAEADLTGKVLDNRKAAAEAPYAPVVAKADADKAVADAAEARRKLEMGPQFNEYQSKSTAFLRRALGSNIDFEGLDLGPRSYVGQKMHENAPDVLNQLPAFVGNSPDRQRFDTTQDEFVAATLRQDSGAAIPPEELVRQKQIYFPQPGETDPTIIAQKREARRRAIMGLMDSAGPAVPGDLKQKAGDWLKAFDQPAGVMPSNFDLGSQPGSRITQGPLGPIDITDDTPDPSLLQQAGKSLLNVGAGIGEGLTALPDMAAKGMGQAMGFGADALGFPNAADALRNTPQIGDMIRNQVPVPQDWNNWGARQAARLEGGALGFPAKLSNMITEGIVGKVPPPPPAAFRPPPPSVIRDADSLGIQPTASAVGGPVSKLLTSLSAQTIGGARPVVAGAQRMVAQGKDALRNIATGQGEIQNAEAAGQTATRGALNYRDASRDAIGRIYDQADKLSAGARVNPDRAVAQLDANLAELSQVPMGSDAANYLSSLKDELVQRFPQGVTIQGLRGLRTQLRDKFYKDGLRGSDIERRVNGIVDTISQDIEQTLIQSGKGKAAQLYRQADQAWSQRAKMIDDVIMPIIGRKGEKSGEQVTDALQAATRGNGARFAQFVKALPEEEGGQVRASLINALGRATSGAQDASGEAFSFGTLLTNWSKLTPTAKHALFAPGDREAMDSLIRVSSHVKDAARYANHSNSGGIFLNGITGLIATQDLTAGLATQGSFYAIGKALSTPGVARVVATLGKSRTPQQARAVVGQLQRIATQNPAAANDVLELQKRLLAGFQSSPTVSAAAQDQGNQVR